MNQHVAIARTDSNQTKSASVECLEGETSSSQKETSNLTPQRSHSEKYGTSVLVICLVTVILIGQHYDWKVPTFGKLTGRSSIELDDWCKEHNVTQSRCVECNPKLLAKVPDYGWCIEHGVHNCTLHHPEIVELNEPFDAIELQHLKDNAQIALSGMFRKDNNSRCTLYQKRIQFDSPDAIRQAGIEVDLVQRSDISETLAGNGEIGYDPTRTASLSSQQPGIVAFIEKYVGDKVSRGEVLAIVDVKGVGEAKAALLRSLAEQKLQKKNVDRLEIAKDSIAQSRVLDAKAALSKATADVLNSEQLLRNLGIPIRAEELKALDEVEALDAIRLAGIPESLYQALSQKALSTNLLPIVSPIDGIVVSRTISLGENVDASQELVRVVDTSRMWLTLSVALESIGLVSIGQKVNFLSDGDQQQVHGAIDWISTSANPSTRMLQVRATLNNESGRLHGNTFGKGQIVLREVAHAVVIPEKATHWEGCCQIVFVRDKHFFDSKESAKVFHVRSVRLGTHQNNNVEVIAGLLPGEVIVTDGSGVLRAQLLKNGLGAGCCVGE